MTTILLVCMVSTAFSQVRLNETIKPAGPVSLLKDTTIKELLDYRNKNLLPDNGMPNAIRTKPLPPVYLGNNNKGFDMYESRVDRMPMLVPDSINAASIPLSKPADGNMTNSFPGYIIPRDKLNELLEKQKKSDSLFMKPLQPKTFLYRKK